MQGRYTPRLYRDIGGVRHICSVGYRLAFANMDVVFRAIISWPTETDVLIITVVRGERGENAMKEFWWDICARNRHSRLES